MCSVRHENSTEHYILPPNTTHTHQPTITSFTSNLDSQLFPISQWRDPDLRLEIALGARRYAATQVALEYGAHQQGAATYFPYVDPRISWAPMSWTDSDSVVSAFGPDYGLVNVLPQDMLGF